MTLSHNELCLASYGNMANLRCARTFLLSDVGVDCWKVRRRASGVEDAMAGRFRITNDLYITWNTTHTSLIEMNKG